MYVPVRVQRPVIVQVKGKPKFAEGGVRTRRQAAAHGPSATHAAVPLPLKLMHVLVQLLQEAESTAAEAGQDWRQMLFGDVDEWDTEEEDDGANGDGDEDNASAADLAALVRALPPPGFCYLSSGFPAP